MEKEAARMEKLWAQRRHVGPDALVRGTAQAGHFLRSFAPPGDEGIRPYVARGDYAVFFRTNAEFLDPKPTQLQIACSIWALRPISGT